MIDFIDVLAVLLIVFGWPALVAYCLGKWRHDCSRKPILVWACLPVPVLLSLACSYIFVSAWLEPQENCGIDACSFNVQVSALWLVLAAVIAGIGLLTARFGLYFARPSTKSSLTDSSK